MRALLDGERDADVLAARIASAIGLSTEVGAPGGGLLGDPQAARAPRARTIRVVVVVEDIHWAEPTLLDLIEHVADWSRDAPILLLCPARPELLDTRTGWGGGKLNASNVLLEPLGAEATARLIAALPGGGALPAGDRSSRGRGGREGNPLYVEEFAGDARR